MIASKVTGRSRTAMRGEAALTVTQISRGLVTGPMIRRGPIGRGLVRERGKGVGGTRREREATSEEECEGD